MSTSTAALGLCPNFKVGMIMMPSYLNDEFELMTAKYGILYESINVKGEGQVAVERAIAKCRKAGIHMVLSTREETNKIQARVNEALGFPSFSDLSLLSCTSKYISRGMDLEKLWRVPLDPYVENVGELEIMIGKVPEYPAILKVNMYTGAGFGVSCVKSPVELLEKLLEIRADEKMQVTLENERQWYLDGIPPEGIPAEVPHYHVEEMVRLGPGCIQYCVDGFVDEHGTVHVWGVFEEMYTPGNMTFGYITPPINLKPAQGPRIKKYVEDYVAKLVAQGWKNQAFCAELWYREKEDIIWMTEVNPRAAWAYTRSFRQTYGAHLIKVATLAAAGKGSFIDDATSPWAMWMENRIPKGPTLVTVVCVTQAGRIGDLLNYDHINELREKGRLVRHMSDPSRVLRQEDVGNAAGFWVLYVYYYGTSVMDLAKQLAFDYPAFWPLDAPVRKNSVLVQPFTHFDPVLEEPVLVRHVFDPVTEAVVLEPAKEVPTDLAKE